MAHPVLPYPFWLHPRASHWEPAICLSPASVRFASFWRMRRSEPPYHTISSHLMRFNADFESGWRFWVVLAFCVLLVFCCCCCCLIFHFALLTFVFVFARGHFYLFCCTYVFCIDKRMFGSAISCLLCRLSNNIPLPKKKTGLSLNGWNFVVLLFLFLFSPCDCVCVCLWAG